MLKFLIISVLVFPNGNTETNFTPVEDISLELCESRAAVAALLVQREVNTADTGAEVLAKCILAGPLT